MEIQQITHEDLLWEALQPIEMALKDKLHYIEVNKFKAYVKTADAKRAFDMTRKTVPSDIPDEKIKTACHYIGNTLFHYAHDLAKDRSYQPRRKTHASSLSLNVWMLVKTTTLVMHSADDPPRDTTVTNNGDVHSPSSPSLVSNPPTDKVTQQVNHYTVMTSANYIIQARVIWLGESIEDLTSKNELLAAQVASLTTESSSSKHRARNPCKEPPNCWKACLPYKT